MTPIRSIRMGALRVDCVTREGALRAIGELVADKGGGAVFTPNVDHVVLAEQDERMRRAYDRVSLSLADGMPLLWASRLLGSPIPEKVSGSDLVPVLLERAAQLGWRVYMLGGGPGVAALAREKLRERLPQLEVVGIDAPRIDVDGGSPDRDEILSRIRAASPDVVLVGLGAPKQEIWIDTVRDELRPAVFLGVGASLDFVAGTLSRAPQWVSQLGLEWAFRLSREPRRLWRRYLVRDPKFVAVLGRQVWNRRP